MAWWTHILFFKGRLGDRKEEDLTGQSLLASFRRALAQYIYDYFVDTLYVLLTIATYVYFGFSVITFLFEDSLPPLYPNIIEIFSEPYLGVLGVYVVVREVERRKGKIRQRTWGEIFAILWIVFLAVATGLTYYSDHYAVSETYKTIVTNALAALIIRIGTIVR